MTSTLPALRDALLWFTLCVTRVPHSIIAYRPVPDNIQNQRSPPPDTGQTINGTSTDPPSAPADPGQTRTDPAPSTVSPPSVYTGQTSEVEQTRKINKRTNIRRTLNMLPRLSIYLFQLAILLPHNSNEPQITCQAIDPPDKSCHVMCPV